MDTIKIVKVLVPCVMMNIAYIANSQTQDIELEKSWTNIISGLEAAEVADRSKQAKDFSNSSEGVNAQESLRLTIDKDSSSFSYNFSKDQRIEGFSFKLQGSLDPDEKVSLPVNLDALSNAVTVEAGYTWGFWPEIESFQKTRDELYSLCLEKSKQNETWNDENPGKVQKEVLFKIKSSNGKIHPQNCRSNYFDFDDDRSTIFLNKSLQDKSYKFVKAGVRVGRESFDFVSPTSLDKKSSNEDVSSLNLSLGLVTPPTVGGTSTLFQLTYKNVRAFQLNDSQNICTDSNIAENALVCQNLNVGAPVRKNSDILHLEIRKEFLSKNKTPAFAISPKISIDLEDNIEAVELPVWFAAGKLGENLDTGIIFGWRSDTDDVTASLFLRSGFKFFN